MHEPECLTPLMEQGIIQEVVRPLMSGKEAQIYLVVSGDDLRVAKVYKEANNRSFHQRVEYTEGRAVRNSRTRRAMGRHSRFGRQQDEAAWRSAEVEIIYKLRAAGLLVPEPYNFVDGVLIMELITDERGEPAPRMADVSLDLESANAVFSILLSQVIGMLCAGVVHGDLSEFNVLLGQYGPVVIDFPQAVDAAHNQSARKLLLRDIDNLYMSLAHAAPGVRRLPYGQEMWELYKRGELTPETVLKGRYKGSSKKANTEAVLYEVEVAERDARRRQEAQGTPKRGRRRRRKPAPGQPSEPSQSVVQQPEALAAEAVKEKARDQGRGPRNRDRGRGGRGQIRGRGPKGGGGQGPAADKPRGSKKARGAGKAQGAGRGQKAARTQAEGKAKTTGRAQAEGRAQTKGRAQTEGKSRAAGGGLSSESASPSPGRRRRRRRGRRSADTGTKDS